MWINLKELYLGKINANKEAMELDLKDASTLEPASGLNLKR